VFDEDQLREMSHADRHKLMRVLAALEHADPDAEHAGPRRRAIVLAVILVCCVVLAAWIGILAVTLPRYYRSGGWRGAWVGFDLALLATFAVTGWAAWRRRQVLIICLVVLATLLCCDAWFDVVLDARTSGFMLSVLSAVFIELPLASLAILGARRLLRLSMALIRRYEGETGETPSLRQGKIVGGTGGPYLSDLFTEGDAPGAARAEGRGGGTRPEARGGAWSEARGGTRSEARGGSRPRAAADHGDRAGPSLGGASDHGDFDDFDDATAGHEASEHEAAEHETAERVGASPRVAAADLSGVGDDAAVAAHGAAGHADRAAADGAAPDHSAPDHPASGRPAPGRPALGHGGAGHRSADPGLYRLRAEAESPARAADEPE
jgi:hypothetical protein